ncbi:MAG TPA: putative quinol monooxygenase [Caulobacteraceae bacterium]|nr:putative quinol monooxygenase [Caulobacteraceae bacterium]
MTIIVAGTVRAPADLDAALPHMQAMVAASRAEDGCIEYAYARDLIDPSLVRVFEIWRDEAALQAHFASPHMVRWRAALSQLGLAASDRRLSLYEIAAERPL